jgi:septum formation protein
LLQNLPYKIVLASKSPRRQFLIKELGLDFELRTLDVDESFPETLIREQIPLYLSEHKASEFLSDLGDDELLITADTIVWINNKVLNKPQDRVEAIAMLTELSGNKHEVFTGVCLMTKYKKVTFFDCTEVYFKQLSPAEIEYYVDKYEPYDKAGAYGAQEWIGYIAVEKIIGSYFNVMGLPVHKVYEQLSKF